MSEQRGDDNTGESENISVFEAVGGWEYFEALVENFYDTVAEDPVLAPLYPDDLTLPRLHTAQFLQQYWGGPSTYSDQRGHPRLRMRHMPFSIGQPERDAWLSAMVRAVGLVPMRPDLTEESQAAVRTMLVDYFDHASTAMINQTPA